MNTWGYPCPSNRVNSIVTLGAVRSFRMPDALAVREDSPSATMGR